MIRIAPRAKNLIFRPLLFSPHFTLTNISRQSFHIITPRVLAHRMHPPEIRGGGLNEKYASGGCYFANPLGFASSIFAPVETKKNKGRQNLKGISRSHGCTLVLYYSVLSNESNPIYLSGTEQVEKERERTAAHYVLCSM